MTPIASAEHETRHPGDAPLAWPRHAGATLWRVFERHGALVLGVAVLIATVLSLWFTRGTTFFFDELIFFAADRGLDPQTLISPHNGHLVAFPRMIYAAVIGIFGPEYFVFRIIQAAGVAVVAVEMYVFARRRIGPVAALVPSIPLLFLGSAWAITLSPLGITHVLCVASGLGALLILERDGRGPGDLAAMCLLVVSIASFSAGIAFVCGAGVLLALDGSRRARLWIAALPLALYVLWYLTTPYTESGLVGGVSGVRASNVLLVPGFAAEAAATAMAALTGLSFDFTNATLGGLAGLDPSWGGPIALLVAVAVALRLRRGPVPPTLWAGLTILAVFWASGGMVTGFGRLPDSGRYVYVSVVGLLLVMTDLSRGLRISRLAGVGLAALVAFGLSANILQERNGGRFLRTYSDAQSTEVAAILIARDRVLPGFIPSGAPLSSLGLRAGPLLAGIDRGGNPGFDPDDPLSVPPASRPLLDASIAEALGLRLEPAGARPTVCPAPGAPSAAVPAPSPGVVLRGPPDSRVLLRRFSAEEPLSLGTLGRTGFAVLRIPPDRAVRPWRVLTRPGSGLTVCPLAGGL